MSEEMQTCNMDERTNEDKLKVNCPEILWPAIRQYAKTCDNELIPAFHYRKTVAIAVDMQARIKELEIGRAHV